MKTVIEVLTEARELVKRGWTQGCNARDGRNAMTECTYKSAVCWCAHGAVYAVPCDDDIRESVFGILHGLTLELDTPGLVNWNDKPGRTQAEVVALFDKAIERAKESA